MPPKFSEVLIGTLRKCEDGLTTKKLCDMMKKENKYLNYIYVHQIAQILRTSSVVDTIKTKGVNVYKARLKRKKRK